MNLSYLRAGLHGWLEVTHKGQSYDGGIFIPGRTLIVRIVECFTRNLRFNITHI